MGCCTCSATTTTHPTTNVRCSDSRPDCSPAFPWLSQEALDDCNDVLLLVAAAALVGVAGVSVGSGCRDQPRVKGQRRGLTNASGVAARRLSRPSSQTRLGTSTSLSSSERSPGSPAWSSSRWSPLTCSTSAGGGTRCRRGHGRGRLTSSSGLPDARSAVSTLAGSRSSPHLSSIRLATVLAPLTKALILIGNALTPGKGFRDGPFAERGRAARPGRPGRGAVPHRARRTPDDPLGVRARRDALA